MQRAIALRTERCTSRSLTRTLAGSFLEITRFFLTLRPSRQRVIITWGRPGQSCSTGCRLSNKRNFVKYNGAVVFLHPCIALFVAAHYFSPFASGTIRCASSARIRISAVLCVTRGCKTGAHRTFSEYSTRYDMCTFEINSVHCGKNLIFLPRTP